MEWLVENWLPAGRVSMLTGEGGAGKSRLALQLAAGIVTGGDGDGGWIDVPIDYLRLGPSVGDGRPVIFASWEDTEDDFSRRLSEISGPASPWITPDRLKMLKVTDLSGYGPAWGQSHPANLPTLTETGQEPRSAAENLGAALLILDPVAAAYAGNENDRGQVRQFIADWDAWGRATNCGVLILAHPPKSGAEYSGSTDWNGAVRSRWAMQKVHVGQLPPTFPSTSGPRSGNRSWGVRVAGSRRAAGAWVPRLLWTAFRGGLDTGANYAGLHTPAPNGAVRRARKAW